MKKQKVIPVAKKSSSSFLGNLCWTIIGQQLSTSVADVIYARFLAVFPRKRITPEVIIELPDQSLRDIGMSGAKVRSVKDLAQKVIDGSVDLKRVGELTDEDVIKTLIQVKGIGPWTCEMFLMFTLGRQDIFSYGDLGLKRAIQKLYAFPDEPSRTQMELLSRRWKPYRTYAALALWAFLDT